MRFGELPGTQVAATSLNTAKGRDLAIRAANGELAFVALEDCRSTDDGDFLVLRVQPEVPQIRDYDVRDEELVGVSFSTADESAPVVYALRQDFPSTPHQNPARAGHFAELCLFDVEYHAIKLRWSASFFVGRLLEWLRLTAVNRLHAADQSLEQVLGTPPDTVVLPFEYAHATHQGGTLSVGKMENDSEGNLYVELRADGQSATFDTLIFSSAPFDPGEIRSTPRTVHELANLLHQAGDDFVGWPGTS
jgi:hypothetical protein